MTQSPSKSLLILGTHDFDIYSVIFDRAAKSLKLSKSFRAHEHPSWIIQHPTHKDLLYVNSWIEGKIYLYRVLNDEGELEIIGVTESGGEGPTHIAAVENEQALLIAHYGRKESGRLSRIALKADGSFVSDKPSHVHVPEYIPSSHHRQDAPHVHGVHPHSSGLVYVPDLGNNHILTIKSSPDGIDVLGHVDGFAHAAGPRHAQVHPSGKYLYTLGEVDSTLIVHRLDAPGKSEVIATYTLVPDVDKDNKDMAAAEIILAPPTREGGPSLLICGNRFSTNPEGDALALFSVSADGSKVGPAAEPFVWGAGKHLRGIDVSPDNKYVSVLARDGGGLVIFERTGEDGQKLEVVAKLPEVELTVVPVWVKDF